MSVDTARAEISRPPSKSTLMLASPSASFPEVTARIWYETSKP